MLCGSKAWYLREKEMAILRKAKRAMCEAIRSKNSEELLDMLGIKESLNRMLKQVVCGGTVMFRGKKMKVC